MWSGADRMVLANIRYVGRARRPDVVPVEALNWLGQVDPAGRPWNDVVAGAPAGLPSAAVGAAVCLLLWRGVWRSDLIRPLNGDSRLHLDSVTS